MNIDIERLAEIVKEHDLVLEPINGKCCIVKDGEKPILGIDFKHERLLLGRWFADICDAVGFCSPKYSINVKEVEAGMFIEITKQETYTKERACNYINYVCKKKYADYKEEDDRSHVLEMVEDEKVWDEDTFGYIKHLMKGCSSFLDFRKYVLKNKIDCTLAKYYGRN